MKKHLGIALVLILGAGLLYGCGSSSSQGSAAAESASSEESASETEAPETEKTESETEESKAEETESESVSESETGSETDTETETEEPAVVGSDDWKDDKTKSFVQQLDWSRYSDRAERFFLGNVIALPGSANDILRHITAFSDYGSEVLEVRPGTDLLSDENRIVDDSAYLCAWDFDPQMEANLSFLMTDTGVDTVKEAMETGCYSIYAPFPEAFFGYSDTAFKEEWTEAERVQVYLDYVFRNFGVPTDIGFANEDGRYHYQLIWEDSYGHECRINVYEKPGEETHELSLGQTEYNMSGYTAILRQRYEGAASAMTYYDYKSFTDFTEDILSDNLEPAE